VGFEKHYITFARLMTSNPLPNSVTYSHTPMVPMLPPSRSRMSCYTRSSSCVQNITYEKKRETKEKEGKTKKKKEGRGEYGDTTGGCVGRFFFQSPEVDHKLGRHPEFVTTGDFTTVVS
jgi:hypothetical protein